MEKRRRVSVIIATIVLVMFILLLGIIVLYSSYNERNRTITTDVEDGVDMLIASTVATPTKVDTSKTFDLSNLKEADNYLYVGFTSDHRLELNLNLEGNGSWQIKDNELIYTYDESSMTLTVTDDVEIVAGVDGAPKLVVRYLPAVTKLNSSMGTEKEFTNADMTAIIKSISVNGNSLDALSVTVSMNREGTKQVSEIDYSSIKQDMVSLITENNIKVVHFTFEDLLTDGIESETLDTNSNVKYYITGDELVVFTDTLHFILAPTNSSELFSGASWQNVEFFKFNNFYTNKVNNTTSMFGGLNNLKAIFVNKKTMKLNKVSSSTNMFLGCTNLVGYYGTGESDKFAFNSALPVDKTYAKIASSEGGYFTLIPAQNVILEDSDWTGWTYGENVNTPFTARFGTIEITYYDENERVVEDIALADAGSYSLVARVEGTSTYTAASLVKQFVISPMNVNVNWYEPTENNFVYNKDDQISSLSATIKDKDGNIIELAISVLMQYPSEANVDFTQFKDAGTYTATASLSDETDETVRKNYTFVNNTHEYTINPLSIAKPVVDETPFEYDGDAHSLAITLNGDYTISANTATTVTDSKIVTVSLKDKANTCWTDKKTDDLEFNLTITPKTIAKPVVSETPFEYDGDAHSLTIAQNDFYEISENTATTVADSKVVSVSLVGNTQDVINVTWNDNSTTNLTFNLTITQKKLTKPVVSETSFEYDGNAHSLTIAQNDDYDVSENTATNVADSKTVRVSLIDKANTCWADETTADLTFNLTITQKKIAKPVVDETSFEYDGQAHSLTIAPNDFYTISENTATTVADSKIVTVSLVGNTQDVKNVTWDDNSTTNLTFNLTITQREVQPVPAGFEAYTEDVENGYSPEIGLDRKIENDDVSVAVDDAIPTEPSEEAYTLKVILTGSDAGNYTLGNNTTITLKITDKPLVNYTSLPKAVDNLVYTGGAQNLITAGSSEAGTFTYCLEQNGTYLTTIPTAINAGDYFVYYKLTPSDSTNYAERSGEISVSIAKMSIAMPTINETTFEYDSQAHSLAIEPNDFYTISTNTATNVADSKVVSVSLIDKANTCWTDKTIADLTFNLTITPKKLTKPVVDETPFVYDGQAHSLSITPNDDYDVSENTATTVADSKVVSVSLIDKANTCWSDETTADLTFNLTITQKKLTKPVVDETPFVYDGQAHSLSIASNDFYTISENTATTVADSKVVSVSLLGNTQDVTNVTWDDNSTTNLTFSLTIAPKTIVMPVVDETSFVYDGNAHSLSIASNDDYTISENTATNVADSKVVTVSLIDTANTRWSDETTADLEFNLTITPKTIVKPTGATYNYTNAPITLISIPEGADYAFVNEYETGVRTDIDSYQIAIKLVDPENMVWDDNTNSNLMLTFDIVDVIHTLAKMSELFTTEEELEVIASITDIYVGKANDFESLTFDNESENFVTNMTGVDGGMIELYMFGDGEYIEAYVVSVDNSTVRANKDCSWMFEGFDSLQYINFYDFNVSGVTNFNYMFNNLKNLKAILVPANTNWANIQATSENMFDECGELVGYYLDDETIVEVPYDSENVDLSQAKMASNGGYFTDLEIGSSGIKEYIIQREAKNTLISGSEFNTILSSYEGLGRIIFDNAENYSSLIDNYSDTPINVSLADNENSKVWLYFGQQDYTITVPEYGTFDLDTAYILSMNNETIYANPDCSGMFYELNVESIIFNNFDTSRVIKMGENSRFVPVSSVKYGMFEGCGNLSSLDLSGFDTSNVTDMSEMFSGCGTYWDNFAITFGKDFDTSNVTDMSKMFSGCSSLSSLDLSGFDTSNVTDMSEMFARCSSLSSLDLSGFNTINVTGMAAMFAGCGTNSYNFAITFGKDFDTSNVTNMYAMFSGCNINSIDLSVLDTSNVESMVDMFRGSKVRILDLTNFDVSKVTAMDGMFYGCTAEFILVNSSWTTESVITSDYMFTGCANLRGAYVVSENELGYNAYDDSLELDDKTYAVIADSTNGGYLTGPDAVETMNALYVNTLISGQALNNLLLQYDIKEVTFGRECDYPDAVDSPIAESVSAALDGSGNITMYVVGDAAYILHNDSEGVIVFNEDSSFMFGMPYYGGIIEKGQNDSFYFTHIEFHHIDTTNVTNLSCMFGTFAPEGGTRIAYDDAGETHSVIDMPELVLDLSDFDTRNVTNMSYMFCASNVSEITFGEHFVTTNVTDMTKMFAGCNYIAELDLSSFDKINAKIDYIFRDSSNLMVIYVNENVELSPAPSYSPISGCSKLYSAYNDGDTTTFIKNPTQVAIASSSVNGIFTLNTLKTDFDAYYENTLKPVWVTTLTTGESFISKIFSLVYGLDYEKIYSYNLNNFDRFNIVFGAKQTYLDNETITTETKGIDISFSSRNDGLINAYYVGDTVYILHDNSNGAIYVNENCSNMFNLSTINNINLTNLNISQITKLERMFNGVNVDNITWGTFDTSNVTSMSGMFTNTSGTTLDLSNFNTSNVTDMSEMFRYSSVYAINLGGTFDTSNVINMMGMFRECKNLISLDLSNFSTASNPNISSMFSMCNNLSYIYVGSNWTGTTSGSSVFGSYNLKGYYTITNGEDNEIGIHVFDSSKSNYTYARIATASDFGYLTSIDDEFAVDYINTFVVPNLTSTIKSGSEIKKYLSNATEVVFGRKTDYEISGGGVNVSIMPNGKVKLYTEGTTVYILHDDADGTIFFNGDLRGMFSSLSSLTNIEFNHIDTSQATTMNSMFANSTNLTSLDLSNFDTTNVNDTYGVFSGCSNLANISLSNFTSLGNYAFQNCTSLTSIVIPSSVTSISNNAFSGCNNLANITFAANSQLTNLETAFYNCSGLRSVTFGDNSQLASIGNQAFAGCSDLTSVTFGANSQLTSIGNSAFEGCIGLTSIEIPNGITSIGESVFSGCSGLRSVTFGTNSQLTSIGNSAFNGCSSLMSIEIPNGLTSIGNSAFSGCSSLMSIEIPNGITSIGGAVFSGCSGLTSIIIPSAVTSVGYSAFYRCSGLRSVTFEANSQLTSIGNSAFQECSRLASIEIPSGVTSIGSSAFLLCYWLHEVINKSSLSIIKGQTGNGYVANYAIIVVSGAEANNYESKVQRIGNIYYYVDENEDIFMAVRYEPNADDLTIDSRCKVINKYAFYRNSSLTSIEIPSSVTSIGNDAFTQCSNLTSVTFEANSQLTTIDGYAFSWCKGLTSIEIPSGVTRLGGSVFVGCSELTSLTLPFVGYSVAAISADNNTVFGMIFGTNSYNGSTSTTQYFNSSATYSHMIYYIPTNLTSVTILGGKLLYGSFYNCSNITTFVIGTGVTSIGTKAFYGTSSSKNVYYCGDETAWNNLEGHENVDSGTIYFYSENQPAGSGNYWHYVDGQPVAWS